MKILIILLTIIFLLLTIAFFTVSERKVMASIQRRRGPNIVGFWGVLQGLADGIKLLTKEIIIPIQANKIIFIYSSAFLFFISFLIWFFIPFNWLNYLSNFQYNILFTYSLSSFGVYGLISAGWFSNSKYAFFGAIRSTLQLISYEITLSLLILPLFILSNSYNFLELNYNQLVYYLCVLIPICIIFLISILAESNRTPFDLPEAEAEIVAGYNIEYSSIIFALFFLAEYNNILWLSFFYAWSFFGSVSFFFIIFLKTLLVCFIIIQIRAAFPRFRYDQLMILNWKYFLPMGLLINLYLICCIFFFLNNICEKKYIFIFIYIDESIFILGL